MMNQLILEIRKSFDDCDLVPNVLRGSKEIDMSVEILGQKLDL